MSEESEPIGAKLPEVLFSKAESGAHFVFSILPPTCAQGGHFEKWASLRRVKSKT